MQEEFHLLELMLLYYNVRVNICIFVRKMAEKMFWQLPQEIEIQRPKWCLMISMLV